jgi:hypothetical protein
MTNQLELPAELYTSCSIESVEYLDRVTDRTHEPPVWNWIGMRRRSGDAFIAIVFCRCPAGLSSNTVARVVEFIRKGALPEPGEVPAALRQASHAGLSPCFASRRLHPM